VLQIKAASPFAPKLEVINSSAHKDLSCQSKFSFNIKPNIYIYKDKSNHWGPTDIFKWATNDDPFGPPTLTGEGENKACSFLHDSKLVSIPQDKSPPMLWGWAMPAIFMHCGASQIDAVNGI